MRSVSSTTGVISVTGWGRLIRGSLNLPECILIAGKSLPAGMMFFNRDHGILGALYNTSLGGSTLNVQPQSVGKVGETAKSAHAPQNFAEPEAEIT